MTKVLVIDATTNTAVERDETRAEAAQRETAHAAHVAEVDAQEAATAAAASGRAKLAELGLTDDEIKALLGV